MNKKKNDIRWEVQVKDYKDEWVNAIDHLRGVIVVEGHAMDSYMIMDHAMKAMDVFKGMDPEGKYRVRPLVVKEEKGD